MIALLSPEERLKLRLIEAHGGHAPDSPFTVLDGAPPDQPLH